MKRLQQCLDQLAAVRSAASDPRGAYLIRSRLARGVLSTVRAVAETTGAPKPTLPGTYSVEGVRGELNREIVAACNDLYDAASRLCQPSESFDVRWEGAWATLSHKLSVLERLLLRKAAEGDSIAA